MPYNRAVDLQPRFKGTTFEGMVETFSEHFGAFDATPIGRPVDFSWTTDFWTNGSVTLSTSLFRNEWQVKAVPETGEWLSILSPRNGSIDVALKGRTIEGRPDRMLLTNNHEAEHFFIRGAPHANDVLRLDWSLIMQTAASILETPMTGSLNLSPTVDLLTAEGRLINCVVQTIIGGMRNNGPLLQSPIAMSHLTQSLTQLVIRMIPHRLSHHLNKNTSQIAPWHVRDAIDFMQTHISEPITMLEVASAVGVSLRALETGFRTFKETTPASYLRTIRLRAVRNDLLDPLNRQGVKTICLKWGFFHFGRFSAVYRAIYGEYPSDTKKRTSGGLAANFSRS